MGSLETKWRSLGKRDRQHQRFVGVEGPACKKLSQRFVEIKVRRTTPKGSMENGCQIVKPRLTRPPEKTEYEFIVCESSDNNRPTTEQNKRSAVSNEKVARAGVNVG